MPDNISLNPVGKVQSTVAKSIAFVNDPDRLQKVLKVAFNALKLIAALKGLDAIPFARFGGVMDNAIELIDTAATIPDTAALLSTTLKAENAGKLGFLSCFVAADWAGVALLFEDYKLFELAAHTAWIGGRHIFLHALQATVGVGFIIKAADVIMHEWPEANTGWAQLRCGAAVARSVTEVAIRVLAIGGPEVLLMVGVTAVSAPTLIVTIPLALGIISAGLGLADYFLEEEKPEEPKVHEPKENGLKPGINDPEQTVGGFFLDKMMFISNCIGKTETLDKICRTTTSIIDIVVLSAGSGPIGTHLRGRVKDFRDTYIVTQLMNRTQEWIGELPKEDNSHKKPFWQSKDVRWWNYLSNGLFTTGFTLEVVHVLEKWKLIDLPAICGRYVNATTMDNYKNIPVFSLIYGSMYTASSAITAIDRFAAYFRDEGEAGKFNTKRTKWTANLATYQEIRSASTAEKRKAAKRKLMDRYESKICLNQLKLQSTILTYTLGVKYDRNLGGTSKVSSNLSIDQLLESGRKLKSKISTANRKLDKASKTNIFKGVNQFIADMAALKETNSELRELSVEITNKLSQLNEKLGASDQNKKHEKFDVQAPLKQIGVLYKKINKEQRLQNAISSNSVEARDYFEWKYYKWTDKSLRMDLKRWKTFNLAFDMTCKAVGGVVGLYFTFNPIGTVFGAALAREFTQDEKDQSYIREWIKTGISSIGSFYGFYALYDVDKQEKTIKEFDANNRFKVDGEIRKPNLSSLTPLVNPANEALDTTVVVAKDKLNDQIASIMAAADQIMCKKFDKRLILRRGMLEPLAPAA